MKSFILLLLIIGIVLIALGYQRKIITNMETKTVVEYRYIPRSIYDEQFGQTQLEASFADMFQNKDVYFRSVNN